jgi:STE24 endopeptidase
MAIDTSTVWLVKLSDRVSVAAALGAAGFSAHTAGRVLGPRDPLPAPVPVDPSDYFSAAEIHTGRSYARHQTVLGLTGTLIEFAALVTVVSRGAQRQADPPGLTGWRPIGSRHGSPPHRVGVDAVRAAGAAAALTLSSTVLTLPLSALARRRSLRAGLATDSWSSWAADLAKSSALEAGLTGALLAGSSALASRTRDRWWLFAGAGLIGVAVVAVTLGPVVLDPLFNDFDPLPEGDTRSDVLALAEAAGVTVGEVYSVDASRRTTAVNAYVNGLGPTKRVVLFDTLLSDYGRDEVRFVVAHELGHVHHRDVSRQIAFMALCAPSMTLAIQRLTRSWAGDLTGARAVPALALASWVVGGPLVLAGAALSRAIEARTDQFGLTLSDAPEGLISFFRRIAIQNRADVTAAGPLRRLIATHPPITERIGAALTYQRATAPRRRTPAGS